MGFSTQRGRPARPKLDGRDAGTPELQLKRALGITHEPIDACLERGLITTDHHRSGLHLRWLYTVRYGAPVITTRYDDRQERTAPMEENDEWRTLREREYQDAVLLLQQARRYECVMRACIFNETPAFLNHRLTARAWHEPALATQLQLGRRMLSEGLELLTLQWRRPEPRPQ